jgi:phage terminase large subunit-like protein
MGSWVLPPASSDALALGALLALIGEQAWFRKWGGLVAGAGVAIFALGHAEAFAGRLIQSERDLPVVEVPQRPTILTPAYGALQKAVIGRKLRYGGHPVLRWCAANGVPVTSDGGLWFLSKRKSTGAIDAVVAAAMAVGRADAEAGGPSVYEDATLRPEGLILA